MYKCSADGTRMIWQNDFDYEDYCMEGEGIVTVHCCPKCDRLHMIYIELNELHVEQIVVAPLEEDGEEIILTGEEIDKCL